MALDLCEFVFHLRPDFDDSAFFDAAGMVYNAGGFDPSQLNSPEARRLIAETVKQLNTAISSGVTHEVPETVRYALENNAFIFSGFKTFHTLREVGLSLTTDKGDIKPFETFRQDVEKVNNKYNHNYLYAEYNHAVGASLMAERWQQIEADGDRYDLQYRTAQDDRVREDHAILHGTTLPPSDPFWAQYLPPNGWNCRCTAVQVRKGKYPRTDPDLAMLRGNNCTEAAKQQIFRFNPGKELKLFPDKHPYYPKGCGSCNKTTLLLTWGRNNEKCTACKHIIMQLTSNVRKQGRQWLKNRPEKGIEIHKEFIKEGYIYFGRNQCRDIICHAYFPDEVLIAKNMLLKFPENMKYLRSEELVEKEGTDKKRVRGITRYDVYEFFTDIREKGESVQKRCELKCEVYQQKDKIELRPYAIKIL